MTKKKNIVPIQLACPQCETEELLAFVEACEHSRHGHVIFLCSHCDEEVGLLEITPGSLKDVLAAELPDDERDVDQLEKQRRRRPN